ncbi:MAG: TerC family protein, partial [Planctomycetes bacterium]|nr:TerC family protein [Planctomycetota bacterium]
MICRLVSTRPGALMNLASLLTQPETYVSLVTLTALEIVLGIDNIVFITILAGRLPPEKQRGARRMGIAVALLSRLALLAGISWVMSLDATLFSIRGFDITGKGLILIAGGLFLLAKATHEMYENVERPKEHQPKELDVKGAFARKALAGVLLQVVLIDMVFSLDSVITAVGMVKPEGFPIMVTAVILAVLVMLVFSGPVGDFVQKHASIRVLALAFLVLIGFLLVTEGLAPK